MLVEEIANYENQFFLRDAFIDEDGMEYPFFLDDYEEYDDIQEVDGNGRPYTPNDRSHGDLDDLETVSNLDPNDPIPSDESDEEEEGQKRIGFDQVWLTSFLVNLRLWMAIGGQAQRNIRCRPTLRDYQCKRTIMIAVLVLGVALSLSAPVQAATHENVIFESIGEMAGATSYLHVQATISLSSLTQQFELYKNKLKARFTDPHRVSQVMNAQFAKNLNVSVNRYLDGKREQEPGGRSPFEASSIVPAPHMNTVVVWTRIAQLHFEDLYEIGLHLSALKSLLPRLTYDNCDRVVAASNFFKNIQTNIRKDNVITDNMEVENEFLEQYPDLQIPDHLSQRM